MRVEQKNTRILQRYKEDMKDKTTTILPHNRISSRSFCLTETDRSAGHSNTQVPGLAFYGAIRTRWCVIMVPYRGKAISVPDPGLFASVRALLVTTYRRPVPLLLRFSPFSTTFNFLVISFPVSPLQFDATKSFSYLGRSIVTPYGCT